MKGKAIETTGRGSGGAWSAAVACALALLAGTAAAQQMPPGAAATPAPTRTAAPAGGGNRASRLNVETATRNWLDLQRSNAAAAPAQPMLGAEAGPTWQRYLGSFKTKIPASLGSAMDSGNGGGGALHVDYSNVGAAQN